MTASNVKRAGAIEWSRMGSCLVLLLCSMGATHAGAETVLVSNTSLVAGSQSSVYSFQAPGPGTVVAQVTNVDWPQTLNSLSFTASSASQVMASWSDPPSQTSQTLSFQVAGPGFATGEEAKQVKNAIFLWKVHQPQDFGRRSAVQVAGPGMYFANVMAAAGGPLDLGVYSLLISFAPAVPVPPPSAGWLLLSGILTLAAWWRRSAGVSVVSTQEGAAF